MARAPRARPGEVHGRRARGPSRPRARQAGRAPRRGPRRSDLRSQRHDRREHGAALARLRAGRRDPDRRPRVQRVSQRDPLRGRSALGARAVIAPVPFPLASPDTVVDAILERVTPRTRLAADQPRHLADRASSFPSSASSPSSPRAASTRWSTAPTHRACSTLDLDALGAAYYTGNAHKWLCTPKGSAFLHIRRDRQDRIRPLAISHGANSPRRDRSRYRLEADWGGTADPTPYLAIPAGIDFLAGLLPGGWSELPRPQSEARPGRSRSAAARARRRPAAGARRDDRFPRRRQPAVADAATA